MIGGLVLIAGLGYYLFVANNSSTIDGGNAAVERQAEAETQEFLRRLNELKTISLSEDLFNDERFRTLRDNSLPTQPVEVGRPNPFSAAE